MTEIVVRVIDCHIAYLKDGEPKFLMLKRLDSTQTSGNGRWVILSTLSDGQTDSNWAITTQSQHNTKGHFTSYAGDASYNYQTLRGTKAGFGLIGTASGWNYDLALSTYFILQDIARDSDENPEAPNWDGSGQLTEFSNTGWQMVEMRLDKKSIFD